MTRAAARPDRATRKWAAILTIVVAVAGTVYSVVTQNWTMVGVFVVLLAAGGATYPYTAPAAETPQAPDRTDA